MKLSKIEMQSFTQRNGTGTVLTFPARDGGKIPFVRVELEGDRVLITSNPLGVSSEEIRKKVKAEVGGK